MLLDEPLSHLDAKLRAQMRAELRFLGSLDRTTTLYVTHDYVEAVALGDRISVLRDGHLIQVGTRDELWEQPADTFVAKALGQPEMNLLRGRVIQGDDALRFRSDDGAIDRLLPGQHLREDRPILLGIRPRELSIEDARQDSPAANGAGSPSAGAAGAAVIQGTVFIAEKLGRKLEVTVEAGDQQLIALIDDVPGRAFDVGQRVTMVVSTGRALIFDAASGSLLSTTAPGGR